MKAIVVYESLWGNIAISARAMDRGVFTCKQFEKVITTI